MNLIKSIFRKFTDRPEERHFNIPSAKPKREVAEAIYVNDLEEDDNDIIGIWQPVWGPLNCALVCPECFSDEDLKDVGEEGTIRRKDIGAWIEKRVFRLFIFPDTVYIPYNCDSCGKRIMGNKHYQKE